MKRALPILLVLIAGAAALYFFVLRKDAAPPAPAPDKAAAPTAKPTPRVEPPQGESGPPAQLELALDDDPAGDLRLEGRVEDADGNPVGDALVALSSRPPRTVKTEADGSFAFTGLLPRTYTVAARHDDEVGGPVQVLVSARTEPVILRLAVGASLVVTVQDAATKAPVANARVQERGLDVQEVVTGKDGTATLRGLQGGANLRVDAEGYAPLFERVPLPEKTGKNTATVLLERGVLVKGRVLDDAGKPVAGARVLPTSATVLGQGLDPTRDFVETGKDGTFAFAALAPGSWRFTATDDSHAPAQSSTITLAIGVNAPEVRIVMPRGGHLAGVVHDKAGQPVPLAQVRLAAPADGSGTILGAGAARQVSCDAAGRFTVGGLPRAKLQVLAAHESGSSEILLLDLAAKPTQDDLVIVLTQDGAISGVVVDDKGQPLAEARVMAWPSFDGKDAAMWQLLGATSDVADQAGAFKLTGLPTGTYQLRAARGDDLASDDIGAWQRAPVTAKTGDTNVRVVVPSDAVITGKIAFSDGTSPATYTVATSQWGGGKPFTATDGSFRLERVAPGTRYVTVSGPGFARKTADGVEVAPGETKDVGTIVVDKGRAVSGRVVDGSGLAVAGATVTAGPRLMGDGKSIGTGGGMGGGSARTATTGGDGRFTMAGFGVVPIMVVADGERGRSPIVEVPPGDRDVELTITLAPAGIVTGKVMAGGQPLPQAIVMAQSQGGFRGQFIVTAGQDGVFRFDRLAPDTYQLSALKPKGMGSIEMTTKVVTVGAGQTVDVTIEMPASDLSLSITVKAQDGVVPPAAQVFFIDARVSARIEIELERAIATHGDARYAQGFVMGSAAFVVENLAPGMATACALTVWGDLNDPKTMESLTKDIDNLPITCQPVEVKASPKAQQVELIVPPKP